MFNADVQILPERFLAGVEEPEDMNGVIGFINGEHDEVGESGHRFTSDITVPDSRSSRRKGNAV
ncbi:MAG: hypothetical protein QM768_09530 [Agriterribacter sp.]